MLVENDVFIIREAEKQLFDSRKHRLRDAVLP